MPAPSWQELIPRVNEVEARYLYAAGVFYRAVDADEMELSEALRIDREIVDVQRRLRRVKGIVAGASVDA